MAEFPVSKPEKSYLSAAVESFSPWSIGRPKPPDANTGRIELSKAQHQSSSDRDLGHRHGLSARRYPKDCPPLNARWHYAVDIPKRKPKLLRDTPPSSKPPGNPKKFVPFSVRDSSSVEAAYQRIVEREEDGCNVREPRPGNFETQSPARKPAPRENTSINEAGNDKERAKDSIKVPVNEDFLFDVDIENRELAPVYWLGPIYEVRRGTWFFQEGSTLKPCEENLAAQLEEGYLKCTPWRHSCNSSLLSPAVAKTDDNPSSVNVPATASESLPKSETVPAMNFRNLEKETAEAGRGSIGSDTKTASVPREPPTYRLFGPYMNSVITYQDDSVAWLSSDGIMARVSSTVYQRFAGGGYLGGVKIVRGYKEQGKGVDTKPAERPPTATTATDFDTVSLESQQAKEQQERLRTHQPVSAQNGAEKAESRGAGKVGAPAALKRELSSIIVSRADTKDVEEASRLQDEKEIQNDYHDHDGEEQSRRIDHLILITHGIGQRLGMRTESVNFVHDVNVLRKTLKDVYNQSADLQALNAEIEKIPKNCRIQVLPVCWRHLLDFPRQGLRHNRKEHDLGDIPQDDELYPSLEDITVEGIPYVRNLLTDLALDILLYQSAYREHIAGIVLRECNRLYKLFVKRNPYFPQNGRVSLIGHSLGSAILFDLLCRQKEEAMTNSSQYQRGHDSTSLHSTPDDKELRFDFPVEDFYCLGSPVGLFQMLKGRTIAARNHSSAVPAESPMDPDWMDDPFLTTSSSSLAGEKISPITGLPFMISSPKCGQLYNIVHPSDPVSYRMEPLISPAMTSLKPQALPYTKKSIFGVSATQGIGGLGALVGQSVSGFWSSLSSGIAGGLLNRSLGLSGEEVAAAGKRHQSPINPDLDSQITQESMPTNTTDNDPSSDVQMPILIRSDTYEKKIQLAEETVAADRQGSLSAASTLIDDHLETLFAGFQKQRESIQDNERKPGDRLRGQADEEARKLRREEMKVRRLNQSGRVDFTIQESALDFNPINAIASHLAYWGDEDVSHFMMSQLLSRQRTRNRVKTSGGSKSRAT